MFTNSLMSAGTETGKGSADVERLAEPGEG
jgi:hypothetical protein